MNDPDLLGLAVQSGVNEVHDLAMISDDNIHTESVPDCRLCNHTGAPLYQGLRDEAYNVPGEWSLMRCPSCALVWLNPRPVIMDIPKAYTQYFTHTSTPPSPTGVGNGGTGWLLGHLYEALIKNGLLGASGRMYVSRDQPGRLLDVGCGSGGFLRLMRGAGWEVEGVEPDPQAAACVRKDSGIKVHVGDVHGARYPDASFDAITLRHVIEHVHDPVALLMECWRILSPGGQLVVTTPNALSLGHRVFASNWRGLDPPRHLHLFSRETLGRCARAAGIEGVTIWTSPAHAASYYRSSKTYSMRNVWSRTPLRTLVAGVLFLALESTTKCFCPDSGEEVVCKASKSTAGSV